jgi:hypothetical protein
LEGGELLNLQSAIVEKYFFSKKKQEKNKFQHLFESHLEKTKKIKKTKVQQEWKHQQWTKFKELEVSIDLLDFYFSLKQELLTFEIPIQHQQLKLNARRANFIFKLLEYKNEEFYKHFESIIEEFFQKIQTCFSFEFISWIFHHERDSPLKHSNFTFFPNPKMECFETIEYRKSMKIVNEIKEEMDLLIEFPFEKCLELNKKWKREERFLRKKYSNEEKSIEEYLRNCSKEMIELNINLDILLKDFMQ